MTPATTCAECGSDPIPHGITYASIVIDEFMRPLTTPGPLMRTLMRPFHGLERIVTPYIFDAFAGLGLAKILPEPDDRTTLLGSTLWEEAKVRGIHMTEWRLFGLPRNIFMARFPDGSRVAFEGIPFPAWEIDRAWWMDDKAILKKEFRKRGLPIAKGGAVGSVREAQKLFATLTPPVIVKPHSGSGSRHTTIHLETPEQLEKAFKVAKQLSPLVVLEEELQGLVYRVTVVDGKLAAVLRRFPPLVVGDGVHTVKELVEKENEHPQRSGPFFSKIPLAAPADLELGRQGLTQDSIPEAGRTVTLHQKINWTVGGTTEDATPDVHPENRALFERIARELVAPVMGMDFIIGDMAKPWHEQERTGVLECNSMPFFENHHIVFRGEPVNVAAKVWEMVTPASA